ncbi:acyl-CoA synthetase (AMP-forming)/AMP-acid ligase II [Panacagrimonas perspica]|uniref:Acyl-CoA synthetase (AMP-forming)/AMP-acid ligase II n=1 Tax=Panacagrimonas perspica TaxID=381431 RepID=A0A4V3F481_9GAMM|nr:long-chain fatty acid--CoA ligase [Panacagrimonas perspica]TDU24216.1 acyl-CoA synthetase (AMP-forming)/AMP-acid ligase II [Panacagrimonas perspica]THD04625.1 fatty-acid--CoA ligase [Panacagrimonas perspica]
MQFTQGLHRAVQQRPNAVATVCNGRVRTMAQLRDRVGRLAAGLHSRGVRRGDRVCMLSLNSDRYLETYLALAWLGAVVNPANFRWNVGEILYSIQDSECVALIVDDPFVTMIGAIRDGAPSLRLIVHAGDMSAPAGTESFEGLIDSHTAVDDLELGGDELLGIFYTGGTTGAPKGVMLSHANVHSSAMALLAEGAVPEGSVALHAAPMFHLADFMLTCCLLLRGGEHVMLPSFQPASVVDLIRTRGISDLLMVPAMLQMLVDAPAMVGADVASVRRIIYGASPASEALLDRVMSAFAGADLLQVYGMTEASAVMSVLPPAMHVPAARPLGRLRSGGRACLHVQIRIVDGEDREVPQGEVGEITARGPNIMQGYLNKSDATTSALKNGWMHTGDMGYMDADGYVFIVDRIKDMIISGGENVYSAEVENAIAKHPAVAACAVVGIPCKDMGEKIHAAVVLKPGATLDSDALYQHCKQLIAGYKCPRSLEVRESLPVSGAGKVLKTELRKPYWASMGRAVN